MFPLKTLSLFISKDATEHPLASMRHRSKRVTHFTERGAVLYQGVNHTRPLPVRSSGMLPLGIRRKEKEKSFWETVKSLHSPSQESSRANFEPKAGLFVKAKSFGSNFNKNLAGILMAREGCLGVGNASMGERVAYAENHRQS